MRFKRVFGKPTMASDAARVRVVPHRPVVRTLSLAGFGLTTALAAAGGYYLGLEVGGLDRSQLRSLEQLERSHEVELQTLRERLVDAQLSREVTAQASAALREDIVRYREEAAALREEVTFYKSLMAPSSVDRGLQIAQFELTPGEDSNQFSYRLLLTQMEARRDWVQGDVRVEVRGRRTALLADEGADEGADEEAVLPLTELADLDAYPLKYRFRYFQDLSGVLALPSGFLPEAVVVTVNRRGSREDDLQRTFEWAVSG